MVFKFNRHEDYKTKQSAHVCIACLFCYIQDA